MKEILSKVESSVNETSKLTFPQTKDEMFKIFIKKMNEKSWNIEKSKNNLASKENETKISLLTKFLTNFDQFCQDSFFDVLQKYIE